MGLVYGDGLDDIKDCLGGGCGLDKILPSGRGRPTRIHGGDTYTRSGSGGGDNMAFPSSSSSNFFEDCDLSFCCNPRFAAALAFLWLLILTIVCISLGSQIAYTSNSEISSRLEELSASHRSRHSAHSRLIDGLDDSHGVLKQRLDEVHGKLGRLDSDVDRMEVRFRGDIRARLGEVRTTLVNALDKVGRSIDEIKREVMQQQQQQQSGN